MYHAGTEPTFSEPNVLSLLKLGVHYETRSLLYGTSYKNFSRSDLFSLSKTSMFWQKKQGRRIYRCFIAALNNTGDLICSKIVPHMLSILQKNVWMLEEGWMKVRRGRQLLKWEEWINRLKRKNKIKVRNVKNIKVKRGRKRLKWKEEKIKVKRGR